MVAGSGRHFRIGVDIGGTFTDIVLLADDGALFSKKLLSTPPDYSEAIEQGVLSLLHETGVANATSGPICTIETTAATPAPYATSLPTRLSFSRLS